RVLAERLNELYLRVGQRCKYGNHAVFRQRHRSGYLGAKGRAVDLCGLLGVPDRDGDMIEPAQHVCPSAPKLPEHEHSRAASCPTLPQPSPAQRVARTQPLRLDLAAAPAANSPPSTPPHRKRCRQSLRLLCSSRVCRQDRSPDRPPVPPSPSRQSPRTRSWQMPCAAAQLLHATSNLQECCHPCKAALTEVLR